MTDETYNHYTHLPDSEHPQRRVGLILGQFHICLEEDQHTEVPIRIILSREQLLTFLVALPEHYLEIPSRTGRRPGAVSAPRGRALVSPLIVVCSAMLVLGGVLLGVPWLWYQWEVRRLQRTIEARRRRAACDADFAAAVRREHARMRDMGILQ